MPRVDPELIGPYLRFLEDPWFKERYDWSYGITYTNYCPPPLQGLGGLPHPDPCLFSLIFGTCFRCFKEPLCKKKTRS